MKKSLIFLITVLSSFLMFSCRDMIHDMKELEEKNIQSFKMVDVSDSFRINTYETTYWLWYEVREWALKNGYRFVLPGKVANKEVTNVGLYANYPVSSVHPADVIVWMNAISEKNGLTPAYYEDSAYKTVLKNAFLISNYKETLEFGGKLTDMNGNPLTTYDFTITSNFYTKSGVNGYRLPTQSEWLDAARGGKNYKKYGVSDDYHDVAALGYVHQPGKYLPNSLGLYDTIGNVEELMLDGTTYSAYAFSYLMDNGSGTLLVNKQVNNAHVYSGMHMLFGFRIAQTIVKFQ